jgi:DNA-binding CsgD family transcriptional regulator
LSDTAGIVSSSSSSQNFVGRSAELLVLEQAIDSARLGMPAVVLVGGDAGIGKSTLMAEAARRADVPIYLGRSTHIGGDVIPLVPLADLARQVRRRAPDILDNDTPDLAALHQWLAPTAIPSPPARPHNGSLFTATLELVNRLATDGAVVVGFEDLHWADIVTWELFEYLARNLIDERIVLAATYRASEVATDPERRRRLAELSRLPATRRIDLRGLHRADVSACVAALTGGRPSDTLVDRVVARGQGNPFFTRELVAAHLNGDTIPIVLSELISADIAGLDSTTRDVLGTISAIGRDTNHDRLAAVVDLADADLERAIHAAIEARLLVVDRDDTYRFRHPLLGEVIYADLLPPQRTRLHSRIAVALQQQPTSELGHVDSTGELALHLERSGDRAGAFTALLAAADAAEQLSPGAAFGHLQRALDLWDALGEQSGERQSRRLWQAAELATTTVGNARAAELARLAFEAGTPPLGEAWGHERLGRYLWSSGDLEGGRVEFERAAQLMSDEQGLHAASVFAGLGQAALMAGDDAAAARWCERVFDLVPVPDADPAAWVMARRVAGIAHSNQGDPETAVGECRQAVAASTSSQMRALATLYLCVALIDSGNDHEAINTALDAVADGQLTGLDQGFGGYFDALAAEALTRLGRWPEAHVLLDRHPLPNTLPVGQLRLARSAAMLAARRGDAERALSLLDDAHALPVDGWHQIVRTATAADVHLTNGNWARAHESAEHGWQTAATSSPLWAARFAMLGIAATVEATLDQRARREPIDVSATVVHLQERIGAAQKIADSVPTGRPRDTAAHLAHAVASVSRLGDPDPDAWDLAARSWTDLGDRLATATARLREADSAASTGQADRATSALHTAHAIASQLGATPLLTEIDAVARRTRISVVPTERNPIDDDAANRLGLTPREAEVLTLVAAGLTNRQIGAELYVSAKTASVHISNILRKLGVRTRIDAAAVAQRLGLD